MSVMRTLATTAATALLVTAPLAALAETDDTDDYTAYGDPAGLAQHLVDAHGYTDVKCVKETPVNEPTYTIDAAVYPNAIALRIQGNMNGKRLILDPVVGKEYPAPAEGDNDKINWVIVCTGTAAEGPVEPPVDEPVEPPVDEPVKPPVDEPVNPPIDTDGPAQRPVDGMLLFGGASLLAGLGVVAVGRRRSHRA